MALFLDLLTLFVTLLVYSFIDAAAIAGGLYAAFKKMGPGEEPDAYDFNMDDKRRTQEFVLRCVIAGAIASSALLIGWALSHMSGYLRGHTGIAGLIVFLVHTPGVFFAAKLMHKLDPIRTAIVTAAATLLFLLIYPLFIAALLR